MTLKTCWILENLKNPSREGHLYDEYSGGWQGSVLTLPATSKQDDREVTVETFWTLGILDHCLCHGRLGM